MNLTFQKILMLRTNDLVRWGRISAVILFLTGGLCILGAVTCYYVIDYKIVPFLARYTEHHQETIDTFGHGQRSDALREANDNVAKINADLIDVCRSLGIVMMVGSGFLALYSGLLSWRSYELASNVQNAEQIAAADRHQHHCFSPTTLQSRRRLGSALAHKKMKTLLCTILFGLLVTHLSAEQARLTPAQVKDVTLRTNRGESGALDFGLISGLA